MSGLSGRCLCGAVAWRAGGTPLWAVFCHCEDCRRAAGADYVSWISLPNEGLAWTGKRGVHHSSPGVTRRFCPVCGCQMSYENDALPGETHVLAASLTDPAGFRPEAHVMWSERVPWLAIRDGLPKHPLWRGNSDPVPEDAP